jgi:hypothetical protein
MTIPLRRVPFRILAYDNTAKRLLADIRELAPDISLRAAEIEAARRIPPDRPKR